MLDLLATWAVPALLAGIPLWGYVRGVPVYEAFLSGAEEGLRVTVQVLPFMLGILVALGVFRASGALDLAARAVAPATERLGLPTEVLPLLLIRPLSGSGSLAAVADLLRVHGPDSFIGRLASVMQGSTDTTFYVLSLYFGSVGVKRPRHAVWAGLCGDVAGFVAAFYACRWFYGPP